MQSELFPHQDTQTVKPRKVVDVPGKIIAASLNEGTITFKIKSHNLVGITLGEDTTLRFEYTV